MNCKNVVTPGGAFMQALDLIQNQGRWVGEKREVTNLVIEIKQPGQESIYHGDIVGYLNDFYDPADDGTPHFETVAQWTFPEEVHTGLTGDPKPDNGGEYYQKLCNSEKGNQIASMVEKLEMWGRNNRTVAQVFNVNDHLDAMFPPCLLDIQVLYRDGKINLTAHYRSHTVCKSYYGDIISVKRLQEWLASRVDADVGALVIFSGSAHIRKKNGEHELAKKMYDEMC